MCQLVACQLCVLTCSGLSTSSDKKPLNPKGHATQLTGAGFGGAVADEGACASCQLVKVDKTACHIWEACQLAAAGQLRATSNPSTLRAFKNTHLAEM